MVNKCSVTGCKSLYIKDKNVKLHRFPLTNTETLPVWIAATGRQKEWNPCKSSRLCGNHFRESEYMVGHGKGILKSTAIPTIDYRVNLPKYNKKIYPYIYDNGETDERTTVKLEETNENVEIVQLDYKNVYESKYRNEHKIVDKTDNNGKLFIDGGIKIENNEDSTSYKEESSTNKESTSYNETTQIVYECEYSNNDIFNRENQCYMFTSSFKEGKESLIVMPPKQNPSEGSSNMNINQSVTDSNFDQHMNLEFKKQRRSTKEIYSRYFKSMKKRAIANNETASFCAFIEAQLKELRPHKKLYLTTKHTIQKILMKAQLKITN